MQQFVRTFAVMGLAEVVVLVVWVVDRFTDIDLTGASVPLRIAVAVAAAVVAVLAYHAWSHRNTVHTICAMLLALLGGAAVVSAVSTAGTDEIYGSGSMALVGTIGIVAAVAVSQIALTRSEGTSR